MTFRNETLDKMSPFVDSLREEHRWRQKSHRAAVQPEGSSRVSRCLRQTVSHELEIVFFQPGSVGKKRFFHNAIDESIRCSAVPIRFRSFTAKLLSEIRVAIGPMQHPRKHNLSIRTQWCRHFLSFLLREVCQLYSAANIERCSRGITDQLRGSGRSK